MSSTDITDGSPLQTAVDICGRYAAAVDGPDPASGASVFADDGVLVVRGVEHRGRAVLAEFFANAKKGIHLAGPPQVTRVGSGELESVSNFLFVANGSQEITRGTYRDRIREGAPGLLLVREVLIRPVD